MADANFRSVLHGLVIAYFIILAGKVICLSKQISLAMQLYCVSGSKDKYGLAS